jgi:nicotinamide mononucleotide (NMN) deamidase PncC
MSIINDFERYNQELEHIIIQNKQILIKNNTWKNNLKKAQEILNTWEKETNKKQNYTTEELAYEILSKQITYDYSKENVTKLLLKDVLHQKEIYEKILSTNLSKKLIEEGKIGNKFGLIELSARLSPCLNFPDSSSYFEVAIIPYGKHSREVIGEKPTTKFVCDEVAYESAKNLTKNFNVNYALAETSSAPKIGVAKSGKKPEVFICGIANNHTIIKKHYIIETHLRGYFNSIVREKMYEALTKMYSK